MSASWCAPCFSSIDFVDGLEEYWEGVNSNVKFITALADVNQPYSCEDWGIQGSTNNTITTVTGANALQGEASLTYDGSQLKILKS